MAAGIGGDPLYRTDDPETQVIGVMGKDGWVEVTPSVLAEAAEITSGARREAYGTPEDNHGCTAAMWQAYIERRGRPLDAYDVCLLNILQKISRLAYTRRRDGLVDIAGYAANAEESMPSTRPPGRVDERGQS